MNGYFVELLPNIYWFYIYKNANTIKSTNVMEMQNNIKKFHSYKNIQQVIRLDDDTKFWLQNKDYTAEIKGKIREIENKKLLNYFNQKIKEIKTKYILKLHTESIKKMKKTIENSLEKLVIITHHLPSIKSIQNRYTNYLVNGTIYSELDCIFSDKIILYCHGHINSNVDYNINGTRVICNTKIIQNNRQGYISKDQENLDFNPNYVITL